MFKIYHKTIQMEFKKTNIDWLIDWLIACVLRSAWKVLLSYGGVYIASEGLQN